MKNLLLLFFIQFNLIVYSQSKTEIYDADIQKHRRAYKAEFTDHPKSPLSAKDTAFVDFFPPDYSWLLNAKFTETPDAKPFDLPTYSGQVRLYRQYGILDFDHKGEHFTLSVYQNLSLMKDSAYKNYLFLPFTDLTNGETTYEGGRYIDFSISDIQHHQVKIDFNKCYNPYCAYSDGYNCPVPPAENRLKIAIPAGEKKFLKEHKSH